MTQITKVKPQSLGKDFFVVTVRVCTCDESTNAQLQDMVDVVTPVNLILQCTANNLGPTSGSQINRSTLITAASQSLNYLTGLGL